MAVAGRVWPSTASLPVAVCCVHLAVHTLHVLHLHLLYLPLTAPAPGLGTMYRAQAHTSGVCMCRQQSPSTTWLCSRRMARPDPALRRSAGLAVHGATCSTEHRHGPGPLTHHTHNHTDGGNPQHIRPQPSLRSCETGLLKGHSTHLCLYCHCQGLHTHQQHLTPQPRHCRSLHPSMWHGIASDSAATGS